MIQPKVVREQIWDLSLEAVELGQRVIAQRQQDADPEPRACDQLGQIDGKAALPLVVQEILLRLVEDQQQVACEPLGPATECVGERFALPFVEESRAELGGQLLAHCRPQAAHWILAPCVEDHHCELRVAALFDVPPRLTAQAVSDARSQHRCLSDTTRPVEHGQPRGEDVLADDPALALPSEEEERVELAVLERHEALVGTLGIHGIATSVRRRSMSATKSSSGTS